jgi:hypothetical protein
LVSAWGQCSARDWVVAILGVVLSPARVWARVSVPVLMVYWAVAPHRHWGGRVRHWVGRQGD